MTKFDMPSKSDSEVVQEDVAEMLAGLNEMIAQPDGSVPAKDVIALFRKKHIQE